MGRSTASRRPTERSGRYFGARSSAKRLGSSSATGCASRPIPSRPASRNHRRRAAHHPARATRPRRSRRRGQSRPTSTRSSSSPPPSIPPPFPSSSIVCSSSPRPTRSPAAVVVNKVDLDPGEALSTGASRRATRSIPPASTTGDGSRRVRRCAHGTNLGGHRTVGGGQVESSQRGAAGSPASDR